jgi:hypothetical protein
LKLKAEQASCSHPRGHHQKKRLHKKFQQKLLPGTLCSLKFASHEKHMKRWNKKKNWKKEVCDTWGCLMAILLILINPLSFSFSFI